jgi:hypothetical protein
VMKTRKKEVVLSVGSWEAVMRKIFRTSGLGWRRRFSLLSVSRG